MKKVTFLLAVGLMCLAACATKKGGERGPRQGGHMVINKDSDSVFDEDPELSLPEHQILKERVLQMLQNAAETWN